VRMQRRTSISMLRIELRMEAILDFLSARGARGLS